MRRTFDADYVLCRQCVVLIKFSREKLCKLALTEFFPLERLFWQIYKNITAANPIRIYENNFEKTDIFEKVLVIYLKIVYDYIYILLNWIYSKTKRIKRKERVS